MGPRLRLSHLAVLAALCAACDLPTGAVEQPAGAEIVSGDGQFSLGLDALPLPLTIRVTARDGQPVHGARVTWSTSQGEIYSNGQRTDEQGIASASWRMLPAGGSAQTFGEKTATATIAGLATPVTFTAVLAHPQRLRAVSFTPDSASTTSGWAEISLRVEAYTMYHGIHRVEMRFAHTASAQTFTVQLARSSGTAMDGVWEGTLAVPPGTRGDWTPLVFITSVDPACDCEGYPQLQFRNLDEFGAPTRLRLTGE